MVARVLSMSLVEVEKTTSWGFFDGDRQVWTVQAFLHHPGLHLQIIYLSSVFSETKALFHYCWQCTVGWSDFEREKLHPFVKPNCRRTPIPEFHVCMAPFTLKKASKKVTLKCETKYFLVFFEVSPETKCVHSLFKIQNRREAARRKFLFNYF